jgi:hypothetical protein
MLVRIEAKGTVIVDDERYKRGQVVRVRDAVGQELVDAGIATQVRRVQRAALNVHATAEESSDG